MSSLNVPFLPRNAVAAKAAEFLRENDLTQVPVDIELVAEQNYHSHIMPYQGLLRTYHVDGFSSSDFSTIYVDEFVYHQRPTRLRFTVAHELGHRVLHRQYLDSLQFGTVEQWIDVLESIDRTDYDRMEWQANAFAGLVLVPQKHLEQAFRQQLPAIQPQIDQATDNGFRREDYIDNAIYAIADAILPTFEVSLDVVTIRITDSKMDELIP